MKAVLYHKYGPADVLEIGKVDPPTPKDDEVRVKVHATSINAADWRCMLGTPWMFRLSIGLFKPKRPRLGGDFAGTVERVGKDVTRFKPGDQVFGRPVDVEIMSDGSLLVSDDYRGRIYRIHYTGE